MPIYIKKFNTKNRNNATLLRQVHYGSKYRQTPPPGEASIEAASKFVRSYGNAVPK